MTEIHLELGKRYLAVDMTGAIKGRLEVTVDEISPSGKWFRLVRPGGSYDWLDRVEFVILEELKSKGGKDG